MGALLGDALGTKIEFLPQEQIVRKYQNSKKYLDILAGEDKIHTSDETLFLEKGIEFFSQDGTDYKSAIGMLNEAGKKELLRCGVSKKMRDLIREYHQNPFCENQFVNNSGMGFLPLILPLLCKTKSKSALLESLPEYVNQTHAMADMQWVKKYFSALHGLIDNSPIYTSVGSPSVQALEEDKNLAIALSGNVEKIPIITGASTHILPAAITLYLASNRDFEKMIDVAFKCFKKTDYDTLFFATGALIGAASGYNSLPRHLFKNVERIEELADKVDAFVSEHQGPTSDLTGCDELRDWVTQDLKRMIETRHRLFLLVPEMGLQEGYDSQQPRHNYTLLEHSLRAADATPQEDLTLRVAALLHDVSKPFTCGREESKTTYHNHAKTGARMAYEICSRLGFSEEEANTVSQLIAEHVINYTPDWSDKAVARLVKRNGAAMSQLFQLVDADNHAQRSEENHLENLKGRVRSLK